MLRTASSLPLTGPSTLGFDPARFQTKPPVCYRAHLAATRTGLPPASNDELTNTDPPLRHGDPPVLLGARVIEVKPSDIVSWISGRREAGLDETTVALVLSHLSAILDQYVDDEMIRRNPCRAKSVRDIKPRRSKKPAKNVPLTGVQLNAVRDNLSARYRAIADVGRALGLRQGEIFGLSPEDIDWTNNEVRIRRQIAHDGNKLVFATLKA
jgi:integrase